MKKLNLTVTVLAALALLAGAALAQDLDPIADADYIGYPDDATSLAGRYDPSRPGPQSDAEWDAVAWEDGDGLVLVTATFDAVADADFLGTMGYHPEAAAGLAYAQCGASCSMDCGNACTDHCGSACAGH